VKVTAESITDEQIRELQYWARQLQDAAQFALLRGERGEIKSPSLLGEVNAARARCAEIWNARSTGGAK